ncbi:MAG: tetratricopeptide repeat protein, partial [Proteobacteria bacterium]|nr:tetratricopeptide repeat protein [Pseudomonadota bacterium]
MAVNKRKVLDAARKFAKKGAKEKALKEYATLLKLEPRDSKLRVEVGDLHRRWGQVDDAITQYVKVADQYRDEGFDPKAVAVYKQILTLDAKRHEVRVSLADVYQRMALDAQAIGELQAAADGYHKEGRKREALELLRKMATLDPTNTTSRLKVADLLRQEGMEDEAFQEYAEVAEEFDRQSEPEGAVNARRRMLELRPDDRDLLVSVVESMLKLGNAKAAEPLAKKALATDEGDPALHELLCSVYRKLDRKDDLAAATTRLAGLYRERGDEDRARELVQSMPSEDLGGGDASIGDFGPGEMLLGDDELGEDEVLAGGFLAGDNDLAGIDTTEDEVALAGRQNEERAAPAAPPAPSDSASASSSSSSTGGDPDQLLAEASVYLRYGKTDQAIESLKAIVTQEPDHRGALDKLGEAYAAAGEDQQAVAMWSCAAEQARIEDDLEAYDVIRDRIAALDPVAAAALPDLGSRRASEEPEPEPELEADDDDLELEVDIDAEMAAPPSELDGGEIEIDLDDDFGEAAESEPDPTQTGGALNTSLSAVISEDLEEAEFYFQQNLYDEAEPLYRRVLEHAPNHPSALLRLGEIEAAREAPAAAEPDAGVEIDVDGLDLDDGNSVDQQMAAAETAPVGLDITVTDELETQPELDIGDELLGGDDLALETDDEDDLSIDTEPQVEAAEPPPATEDEDD